MVTAPFLHILLSPVGRVGLYDLVVQVQEGQSSDGFGLEVQLLGYDLLHASQVGHREPALANTNELVCGRQVALLLCHFSRHVEAAEANAGQVLGLDLRWTTCRVRTKQQVVEFAALFIMCALSASTT